MEFTFIRSSIFDVFKSINVLCEENSICEAFRKLFNHDLKIISWGGELLLRLIVLTTLSEDWIQFLELNEAAHISL